MRDYDSWKVVFVIRARAGVSDRWVIYNTLSRSLTSKPERPSATLELFIEHTVEGLYSQ